MTVSRVVRTALAFAVLSACAPRGAARPAAVATGLHAAAGVPGWTAAEVRMLQARLHRVLGGAALATSGVAILDAGARPLFVRRERAPMVPASTFKLLVGTAALTALGPDFRFTTTLECVDEPHDGTLDGDVYVVGSGDPSLTRDDLRAGVATIARAGLRRVRGGVVADATAFSGPEVNRGWERDDLEYGFAAGTSALSLDQGTVEFHLVPGLVGAPAAIRVLPRSDAVRVIGGVVTAYSTLLSIERAPARNDFTFSGRIEAGAEQSFWRPVVDLPRYAAQVVRATLRGGGIAVDGAPRAGLAPVAPLVLWRHRSKPLRDIVRRMMFESNNHFAEQLLRATGATRGAGSDANGALVERDLLRRDGVPQDGLRIVDGSGLAPSDRVAPLTLATLLARFAREPDGPYFIAAIPRIGIEGTVKWRHVSDARGRARGKSGHIADVNALAGYVQTRGHGRVAFALLVNGRRADDRAVDRGIDAALDVLARS
ncbi:MAG: D-alanyl-D-alanine carboxypeptidase/D-alanyl-D-alanine-endopeptidase [Candidatus Eremiobacteraeota bacterium]|nr:D-alanyl-D-alanine carboxypeptidase/D-alanyl-D-alanine-endopeptidase [Candidatus Eremiobacteraeota bacterium]